MTNGQITNIEVKKNNRNRIFRYICKHDVVSNPDISYELKMSLPTVTQNTKELIERGVVQETGMFQSTGGRKAKALSVAADYRLAAGLDITKNHISFVLVNLKGEIRKYQRIHLPYENSDVYYGDVSRRLEAFLDQNQVSRDRLLGLGISVPGIVNLDRERIDSFVLQVKGIPFEMFRRFFPYPCSFHNDANAGAYAEGLYEDNTERFFYLSLSNTVGGSIFTNKDLVQGSCFRCGEVGHMTIVPDGETCYCGKKGCTDVYCSASRLTSQKHQKLEDFFQALGWGEKEARQMWEDYTSWLAIAVNNIHMVLDCNIVLGGYVGSYIEPYMDDIWIKVAQRNSFFDSSVFLRTCHYKTGAAALGAALRVIEDFIQTV